MTEKRFTVKDNIVYDGWASLKPVNCVMDEDATDLAEFLNRITGNISPTNFDDAFTSWYGIIEELSDKERRLIDINEIYSKLEDEIISTTDFEKRYGKNNQKVRDKHVKRELKDLVDEKNDITLRISYLKRKIEFIKSFVNVHLVLVELEE